MNQEQAALYRRIREFPLDEPGSAVGFTRRLAAENGWSLERAGRVVEEYRKFAFLAAAAGHPVSPSDAVDQAWHLHMTYTRSYWDRFCGEVLRKPLHHEPTKGGIEEERKFARWYSKTLGSYRAFFRSEPPADVWPQPGSQAGISARFERVDRTRSAVVPRFWLRGLAALAAGALLVAVLLRFGDAIESGLARALNLRGPSYLALYAQAFGAVLAAGLLFRALQRKADRNCPENEEELHPYEAAYLAGGARRATDAALASLVAREILGATPSRRRIRREGLLPADAHPLEASLYEAAGVEPGSETASLHRAGAAALERIRSRLVSFGLWVPSYRNRLAVAVPLVAMAALACFGLAKIDVGLERQRPVGYLVLLVLVSVAAAVPLFGRPLRRTRRGDRALRQLKRSYRELQANPAGEDGAAVPDLSMAVALFGVSALSGDRGVELRAALQAPTVPTAFWAGCGGSGGAGASCGGGGGGGGGGCGGCGGGGS
ncbi:MAG: TIGR04222 domain-containing membrane protein [Planctomycetaceae bacterium]|nr:TIGR04222 domain-containing membrane protein [Planctomycetaceae bacterium]